MKLKRRIPQYVPIFGRKMRFYYQGMVRACSNCFEEHARRRCQNRKVQWTTYGSTFIHNNPSTKTAWYSRWWNIVESNNNERRNYVRPSRDYSNRREVRQNQQSQRRPDQSRTREHSKRSRTSSQHRKNI